MSTDHLTLRRDFTLWSSFAFAFAFISPIVALYAIFGLAITTAGPSFWWAFPLVFAGQVLVAFVFAMLVSRWPFEGSIYQWAGRLMGRGFGWFAGWTYVWTLVIAMATVALGAAGFVANLLGIDAPSGRQVAFIAAVILLLGTSVNLAGRNVLKWFMTASIVAEIIGSLGIGTWLLLFHRNNSLAVLTTGGAGASGYLSLSGPFLAAVAFVGFSFVGFESAGAIAEEVSEPRKNLPKAIVTSITLIAAVVMFASLAIILAIPDLSNVGDQTDPVYATLTSQLGSGIAKPVEALFVVGFVASFLALQTSASRFIWSYARDHALPFDQTLARLSEKQRQPTAAILVTTVIGLLLFLLSILAEDVYTLMVNFTSGGFYLAFLFPLVGMGVSLLRGTWVDGTFSLKAATRPVLFVAVIWVTLQFLNIAWPRAVYDQRYLDWSVWIAVIILGVIGAAVWATVRNRVPRYPTTDTPDDLPEKAS